MKNFDPSADVELELAKTLVGQDGINRESSLLPDSIVAQLSPQELEEFRRAQECLNFLQYAAPPLGRIKATDQSTARGETLVDENNLVPTQLPEMLGRFEIIRELGRGGFGVVLLARDPVLQRNVALKIPKSDSFLNSDSQKRFDREARAAAVLSHPAIVPIFETGHFGPVSYIAFEYCEGESLAQWLENQQEPVQPEMAASIVKTLADAVQHAHSRGVIHRDLKPANVLIAKSTSNDLDHEIDPQNFSNSLRITDFGLARLENENDSLTQAGAIIGTPAYMAPELANCERPATASVDIYSLGVMLYLLVTGKVPFEGKNHLSTLKLIAELPAKSPRQINKQVPKDLSAICLRCLEKEPQRRYSSCQELSDDLNRCLHDRPVLARETTAFEKTWRWSKRNPLLATSLASVIAILATSTLLMSLLWINMTEAWKTSSFHEKLAATQARQALTQTKQLRSAVQNLLTGIANEPSIKSKNMEQFRKKLLTSATRFYNELRENVPDDDGLLEEYLQSLTMLAEIHQRLDDHQGAIEICQEALGLLDGHERHPDIGLALELKQKLAFCLREIGEFEEAEKAQNSAIELAFASTLAHPKSVPAALRLAEQLNHQARGFLVEKDFRNAERLNSQAIELVENTTGEKMVDWSPSESKFQIIGTRADIFNRTERTDEGLGLAELAREMFEQIDCPNEETSTNLLTTKSSLFFMLGVANSNTGNYSESGEHFDNAIDSLSLLCARHPDVGRYQRNRLGYQNSRALIYYLENQLEDAENLLVSIVNSVPELEEKFPQSKQETRFYGIKAQELLQAVYRRTDRPETSRDCLLSAIESCRTLIDEFESSYQRTSTLGNLYNNLGLLESSLEEHQLSKASFLQAVEILAPIARDQDSGEVVSRLHNAYMGVISASDATEDFDRAIMFADRFLREVSHNDPRSIVVRRSYATWLARGGEVEESIALIEQLEKRCVLPEDFYQLSRTTARCAGALPEQSDRLSSATIQKHRDRYHEKTVDLLGLSVLHPQSRTTQERVKNENDFDLVRREKAFQTIVETLH